MRPPTANSPATNLAISNTTSNLFLGAPQRSWMSSSNPQAHPSPQAAQPPSNKTKPVQRSTATPATVTLPSDPPSHLVNMSHIAPSTPQALTRTPQHSCIGESPQDPQDQATPVPMVGPSLAQPSDSQSIHGSSIQPSSIEQHPPVSTLASSFLHPPTPEFFPEPHAEPARKRSSTVRDTAARRTRSWNNDSTLATGGPVQLPTPHNSPVPKTTTALMTHFNWAVDVLQRLGIRTLDLEPVNDIPRLAMLRDACSANDKFFITTHVIFCAWSWGKAGALKTVALTPAHFAGLGVLEPILGSQRHLTKEVAHLFLRFPESSSVLATPSSILITAPSSPRLEKVRSFLNLLSTKFPQVRATCAARGYPPCPRELQRWLDLPSPILQKSLYMSLLRDQFADSGSLAYALAIFEQELNSPTSYASEHHMVEAWSARFAQLHAPNTHTTAVQHQPHPQALTQQPQMPSQYIHPADQSQPSMSSAQNAHLAASYAASTTTNAPFMNQPPNLNYWPAPSVGTSNHHIPSSTTRAHLPSQLAFQHLTPTTSVQAEPVQYHSPTQSTTMPFSTPAYLAQHMASTNSVHSNPPVHTRQPLVTQPLSHPSQQLPSAHPPIRFRAPTHPRQVQPQSQPQPQPQPDRFFPPDHRHVLPALAQPTPNRIAIHQVESHVPDYHPEFDPVDKKALRYYRYVEQIIMLSQPFEINSDLFAWNLDLSPELMANKVCKIPSNEAFGFPKLQVAAGLVQFRLKCMKRSTSEQSTEWLDEDAASAPTTWPKCLSISINGDFGVDFQRKAHHGLDLSTDVTDLLHEGPNEVKICIILTPQEQSVVYYMCLEIIRIATHEQVVSMPETASSKQIKDSIMGALSRKGSQEDDDDLVIADSIVSIDLVDPFMSTLWVTPVRGKSCQHRECFDLEAFLLSRTARVKGSSMTNPDQWKCPICRKDARPQSLIIDGFLLEVRKQLEAQGALDTKAILVKEDGSWLAKPEAPLPTRPSQRGHTATETQDTKANPSPARLDTTQATSTENTIIVLDDDA